MSVIVKIENRKTYEEIYMRTDSEFDAISRYCDERNLTLGKQSIFGFTATDPEGGETDFHVDELEIE